MKQITFLFAVILSSQLVYSQSVYSEKWKETLFFSVPHSFEQKEKTTDHVCYIHEQELATLEIREVTNEDKAVSYENLKGLALEVAEEMDYSLTSFEEYPINSDESFLTSSLLIKGKKKRTLLTALYSKKTDRNYIILIEANSKYFKNNEDLIKQLSGGLIEL